MNTLTWILQIVSALAAVISAIAAVVAVKYAWKAAQAAGESSKQAAEALQRVGELITITTAAHQAAQHDRHLHKLYAIAAVVERVHSAAADEHGYHPGAWRCPDQNELGALLAGIHPDLLPACRKVPGATQALIVMADASDARGEVAQAIKDYAQQHQS